MAETDGNTDRSSRSTRRRIATPIVLVVLCSPALVGTASLVVGPDGALAALVGLCGLAITLLWRRPSTDGRNGDGDAADDGSTVWNAIPSRQYGGRHAEAGGIARDEQERALRDVQRQAEELAEERRQ